MDVSRMVDTDILIQIWKNRVKKIDFVLKWLSRVGSEVGPTKVLWEGDTRNRWRDGQGYPDVGQGTMAPWARRLGRGGKRVRERERKEGGGGEKKVRKGPGERTDERRRKESRGETERSPPCIEKRPESGIGVKKTMNAGGVENGI
ncbi:hypothetical protein TNCV_1708791 [Trichonephila clavipes]|nr:hypothetical protein TNCV_1708791 [Trichonephila clavipes]